MQLAVSTQFRDDYYKSFSIVWGAWIVVLLIAHVLDNDFHELSPEDSELLSVIMALVVVPAVTKRYPPLITPNEL